MADFIRHVRSPARQMIIATETNGCLARTLDSPCIFSGSNGHVPPLIEGGRGVGLPREIRDNELRVTRARREMVSLSLSLSLFVFLLLLYRDTNRAGTNQLLTTPLSISPPSDDDDAVVNHHSARHQYHRERSTTLVARRGDEANRKRR